MPWQLAEPFDETGQLGVENDPRGDRIDDAGLAALPITSAQMYDEQEARKQTWKQQIRDLPGHLFMGYGIRTEADQQRLIKARQTELQALVDLIEEQQARYRVLTEQQDARVQKVQVAEAEVREAREVDEIAKALRSPRLREKVLAAMRGAEPAEPSEP